MASRDERMQQRLRGTQIRQVKDVDFGIVFPALAAPSKAALRPSTTPPQVPRQSELPRLPPARRTPANVASSSATPLAPSIIHSTNDANTSAKRRKLDTPPAISASSRTTRSSQKTPRTEIRVPASGHPYNSPSSLRVSGAAHKTLSDEVAHLGVKVPVVPIQAASTTPTISQPEPEVNESLYDTSESGPRNHGVIDITTLASSQLHSTRNNNSLVSTSQTPLLEKQRNRGRETQTSAIGVRKTRQDGVERSPLEDEELDELSPEQPTIRTRGLDARINKYSPELLEPSMLEEQDEQEEAEAIDDQEATTILNRIRSRKRSINSRVGSTELGSDLEAPKSPVRRRQKQREGDNTVFRTQRHPKPSIGKSELNISKPSKTARKVRAGSPIPITIHRYIQPSQFGEREEDAHILNVDIPHAKRKSVNVIDVLRQICQEMVGSALTTLEEGGNNCDDTALRREYKTKWNAVSSFGRELQARLLEHTIILDHTYSLRRRLRDEQRRKLGLREDILRVRREREQVALRMDEIRGRHETEKATAQERDTLNNAVLDVELAIDLGQDASEVHRAGKPVDAELKLKRVVSEVSSLGSSDGLLKQMKDFNEFLERSAQALESRKIL